MLRTDRLASCLQVCCPRARARRAGLVLGLLVSSMVGCGDDAATTVDAATYRDARPPADAMPSDAMPPDAMVPDAMQISPDASLSCAGDVSMLMGGSLDGELDNERVAHAAGSLFVLRRRIEDQQSHAQLWRVETDGSDAVFLHEIPGRPRSIAGNAEYAYYSTGAGGIWRFPVDGTSSSTAEQITTEGAGDIHLTSQLYYTVDSAVGTSSIYRADLDGGNSQPLIEDVDGQVYEMAHRDGVLYYTVFLDGLYRLDDGSSSPLSLTPYSNGRAITFDFAMDRIFYVTFFGRSASVNLDGSAHAFHGPDNPNHAVRASRVLGGWFYWGNGPSPVRRLDLATKELQELAATPENTTDMTTDGSCLYSVNSGRLWSIPPNLEGGPLP